MIKLCKLTGQLSELICQIINTSLLLLIYTDCGGAVEERKVCFQMQTGSANVTNKLSNDHYSWASYRRGSLGEISQVAFFDWQQGGLCVKSGTRS